MPYFARRLEVNLITHSAGDAETVLPHKRRISSKLKCRFSFAIDAQRAGPIEFFE
jgi:hypothetical protein